MLTDQVENNQIIIFTDIEKNLVRFNTYLL